MLKRLIALLAALMLPVFAQAGWQRFPEGGAPDNLGFLVSDYTGRVTITFLGDCTLGGEDSVRNSRKGFGHYVRQNGFGYPFRNLLPLTESDDVTVANLEGVLTDRNHEKAEKKFNFRGPAEYTKILTAGGIECVSLANNHSHDFGNTGYADTKAALDAAGIAYFGEDGMAVWENGEGLRIGFVGAFYSLTGSRLKHFTAQVETLKELGCEAVIAVMHAGNEYADAPNAAQRQIAETAVSLGCALVVGHHPHVVQGYDLIDGVPVAYSLGNCSFGGTTRPKAADAVVLRASLDFEGSVLRSVELRFYPISITGSAPANDYCPVLLSGKDAERVLRKMTDSTGRGFDSHDDRNGAVVFCPVLKGE